MRPGGRRGRWLEPFLLLLVAEGEAHGWVLINRLNELGMTADGVDVGMDYRTLREFEEEGLVASQWAADSGAPRRAYRLTEDGRQALDEWIAVMEGAGQADRRVPRTECTPHARRRRPRMSCSHGWHDCEPWHGGPHEWACGPVGWESARFAEVERPFRQRYRAAPGIDRDTAADELAAKLDRLHDEIRQLEVELAGLRNTAAPPTNAP